jgi:hypothetical protein
MKAIEFIQEDTGRIRGLRRRAVWLGLGLGLLSAILGLGMRRDFVEAFTVANFIPLS